MMWTLAKERAELLVKWEKDYQDGRLSEAFGRHAHRILPDILDALEAAEARVKELESAAGDLDLKLWTDRFSSPTMTAEYIALKKVLYPDIDRE